ncbi:Glycosyltransferase involved in cell wall bisynthesis [Thioclava dalianensis]|uniref:glycosyltransferase n=1 Tax=Thioclava dalianensis TaxID=1185766 RepID=UPI0008F633E3|nr:glycosyltransferase [Thioclava dalianensis]SFN16495.1 Glycosyltransferase involved in cell wall bisynthesis [Thioclava dalianensis]
MAELSIVVPIYNVEEYLHECLASIQSALHSDFDAEVICVNDGSTDKSEEIVKRFVESDQRFRLITQANGGYGKAINTGMRAATGAFFTIVESDDLITIDAYVKILEILRRDESVDFVKAPYQPFNLEGDLDQMAIPVDNLTADDILSVPVGEVSANKFTSDKLIFQAPAIWAGVYRRSSIDRHKVCLPETPGAGYQDTCFSAMCFLNGMTYYWISDRYYMYRVDREAASRHQRNRRSEIVALFAFVRKNLEENSRMSEVEKPYYFAVYFRRLIWFMQRCRVDHRFNLFFDAYRAFFEVWEDQDLRRNTRSLLPSGEAVLFDDFYNGRQSKLYGF